MHTPSSTIESLIFSLQVAPHYAYMRRRLFDYVLAGDYTDLVDEHLDQITNLVTNVPKMLPPMVGEPELTWGDAGVPAALGVLAGHLEDHPVPDQSEQFRQLLRLSNWKLPTFTGNHLFNDSFFSKVGQFDQSIQFFSIPLSANELDVSAHLQFYERALFVLEYNLHGGTNMNFRWLHAFGEARQNCERIYLCVNADEPENFFNGSEFEWLNSSPSQAEVVVFVNDQQRALQSIYEESKAF